MKARVERMEGIRTEILEKEKWLHDLAAEMGHLRQEICDLRSIYHRLNREEFEATQGIRKVTVRDASPSTKAKTLDDLSSTEAAALLHRIQQKVEECKKKMNGD